MRQVLLGGAPLGSGQGGATVSLVVVAEEELSSLVGVTWATDGNGRGYNTPNKGSEIVLNGDMESGSPPSSWPGASAIVAASADANGGAQALRVESTSPTSDRAQQSMTTTANRMFEFTAYVKAVVGSDHALRTLSTLLNAFRQGASGTYQQLSFTDVFTGSTTTAYLYATFNNGSSGDVGLFDDVSVRPLILSTVMATTQGTATNTPKAAAYSIEEKSFAGVVGWVDDIDNPANGLLAFHTGISIGLLKLVGGVYSSLIYTGSTFAQDAQIEIRRPSGNTFQLYYNDVQVGTDQTVNDAAIASNSSPYFGALSTNALSRLSSFYLDDEQFLFPGA